MVCAKCLCTGNKSTIRRYKADCNGIGHLDLCIIWDCPTVSFRYRCPIATQLRLAFGQFFSIHTCVILWGVIWLFYATLTINNRFLLLEILRLTSRQHSLINENDNMTAFTRLTAMRWKLATVSSWPVSVRSGIFA